MAEFDDVTLETEVVQTDTGWAVRMKITDVTDEILPQRYADRAAAEERARGLLDEIMKAAEERGYLGGRK